MSHHRIGNTPTITPNATVSAPSRRSVLQAAAWSVPAVSLTAASPAFATSQAQACTLVTQASKWSVVAGTTPLRPHTVDPLRLETGWMNSSTVTTTGTVAGALVAPSHGDSMLGKTTHADLRPGAFISWQDAGTVSTDGTATQRTVLHVDYRFTVNGPTTVTIGNRAIFQYGNPNNWTSRQTLTMELLEEITPATATTDAVTGPALWTTKIAARRQNPNGSIYPTATHPLSYLIHTDSDLVSQGFTLVNDVPATGRYEREFNATPSILNAGASANAPRTYIVRYTFTLYPRFGTSTATDDVAVDAPIVTTIDGC